MGSTYGPKRTDLSRGSFGKAIERPLNFVNIRGSFSGDQRVNKSGSGDFLNIQTVESIVKTVRTFLGGA